MRLDENWTWEQFLVRIKAGKTKDAITYLQQLSKKT